MLRKGLDVRNREISRNTNYGDDQRRYDEDEFLGRFKLKRSQDGRLSDVLDKE